MDQTGRRGKRRGREKRRGRGKARGRQSEERALPSVQHARARAYSRSAVATAAAPPMGRRCSCRLRGVGAVLMPNVFVPMHQPLLPRSGALATIGLVACCVSDSPRSRQAARPIPLVRLACPFRVSVLASLVGLARCSSLKRARARARVAQKCRMSGRTRAETRVTPGIALSNVTQPRHLRHRSLCPPLPPPHTLRGTARPRRTVCVLF